MHIRLRAPLLSAAFNIVCVWIIGRPLRVGPRVDRRALDNLDDLPRLALADRTALDDRHRVAFAASLLLVVRHDLRGAANELAVHGMLDEALDRDGNALVHLVAHDAAHRPTAGFARLRLGLLRAHPLLVLLAVFDDWALSS